MNRWILCLAAGAALTCAASLHAEGPEPAQGNEGVTVIVNDGAGGGFVGGGGIVVVGEGAEGRAAPGAAVIGERAGANDPAPYIQNLEKTVTLTDDQKQAITDIFAARKKATDDFNAKNGEKLKTASKAVADAFKAQDKEAITRAMADYQALAAPLQEIQAKATTALNKVLTKEQKAQIQDARADAFVKSLAGPVKLTPDQTKQLKAAFAEGDGNNYGATANLFHQILTPEQEAALPKPRLLGDPQAGQAKPGAPGAAPATVINPAPQEK